MGDIINSTYAHSLEWQKPLTWMRVNIAYMASELSALDGERGEHIQRLRKLLTEFEAAFASFARDEMHLFTEARTAERSPLPGAISGMIYPLLAMEKAFNECILGFHAEVRRLREVAPAASLLPLLCQSCGAELLGAYSELVDAIGRLKTTIERNLD